MNSKYNFLKKKFSLFILVGLISTLDFKAHRTITSYNHKKYTKFTYRKINKEQKLKHNNGGKQTDITGVKFDEKQKIHVIIH